jgi:hypothetical protein
MAHGGKSSTEFVMGHLIYVQFASALLQGGRIPLAEVLRDHRTLQLGRLCW